MEELVQETIIRAVRYLPSLHDESQVSNYLYAIARHVAVEHLRRKRRAEPAEEESIGEPHADEAIQRPTFWVRLYRMVSRRRAQPHEAQLMKAIDSALSEIEEARLEARSHDGKIKRLGEETRLLIDEMMEELNLKAA